jgi:hypothetical protein
MQRKRNNQRFILDVNRWFDKRFKIRNEINYKGYGKFDNGK